MAPDKYQIFPMKNYNRLLFFKTTIKNPNIIVGDYTYYDDFENVENFEKNVKYHFDFFGDGAIIATNSTVTKEVLPYSIVGGNPSQLIRMRFTDEQINSLLEIQWWKWNID